MLVFKKTWGIVCFCILLHVPLSAQTLMHSFGVTTSVIFGTVKTSFSSQDFLLKQSTFTYFPRLNFLEGENSSVSIGAPVGVGFGLFTTTDGSDMGLDFAYDLPVVLDYNIGFKSTEDNPNNFGVYFGAGFGYFKVNISGSQYSDYNGATYGPMGRAGVRIGSSSESWKGHGLTIGVYYKKGMESDHLSTIGFNILYDL